MGWLGWKSCAYVRSLSGGLLQERDTTYLGYDTIDIRRSYIFGQGGTEALDEAFPGWRSFGHDSLPSDESSEHHMNRWRGEIQVFLFLFVV